MSEKISITVLPNGPIKVSAAKSIKFCGEQLSIEGDAFLCRCGKSKNAPFCDGSHVEAGFSGDNQPGEKKDLVVWEGKELRTYLNPNACMHAFYCKPLNKLREQELGGDTASGAEIMRVVRSCPSGALTYEVKGEATEPGDTGFDADIDIVDGGEVRVQCAFEINENLLERQHENRATLCRCGQSKNKPWCDGRHKALKNFR
jgi:CDGSH-type Zn-finger protein